MFVCCECCVLSGRGLCDGLIICPEESYRLWRVVVCDQETSHARRLKPATGLWEYKPTMGCNASRKKKFLHVVLVALIVDWDGLTMCCDRYWFFHGWRHLRKGCWGLYVEYDLLHTGVHLLWLK